jgi:formylglycine-generating enzyme required for sulfatase activity
MEMIWLKPGTFMMGSPETEKKRSQDEVPHEVTLTKGFYLGKYEVTQRQWMNIMNTNPSEIQRANLPVSSVSWEEAVKFCVKLSGIERRAGRLPDNMSYHLPTEAQWEYACRAGTKTTYSWGDNLSPWNSHYNAKEPKEVGSFPSNPWGFYDMHGNVGEWCYDWKSEYPSTAVKDPAGPAEPPQGAVIYLSGVSVQMDPFRICRGGSFLFNIKSDSSPFRSASRSWWYPSSTPISQTGFRVALRALH